MNPKNSKSDVIAIVLPAYNEAAVIRGVLDSIPTNITLNGHSYPVMTVVVNDGSTDGTSSEVRKQKNVHLINHMLNSGAGAATRTGINYSKEIGAKYVCTMDSDGQHDIKDVVKVLANIAQGNADFVIGSRLVDSTGMPWYRILGNWGLSIITYAIFGIFVRDSQSGLRAFNRQALDKIDFHSNEYAFCSEMIWSAHRHKLQIREVPITAIYTDYSLAKGQTNWGALQIVGQMMKRRIMQIFHG